LIKEGVANQVTKHKAPNCWMKLWN